MRTQVMTVAAALMLCGLSGAAQTTPGAQPAQGPGSQPDKSIVGSWKSAPDRIKLTTDFDKSVWGPDATSERIVDLTIRASGEGTMTVTRRVIDARGRTVPASTSIEEARLRIGARQEPAATRIEHAVTVVAAERRYPDDPGYKWPIEGLKVKVVTFTDDKGRTLEVRFDTPEGTGSFWETLTRTGTSKTG